MMDELVVKRWKDYLAEVRKATIDMQTMRQEQVDAALSVSPLVAALLLLTESTIKHS